MISGQLLKNPKLDIPKHACAIRKALDFEKLPQTGYDIPDPVPGGNCKARIEFRKDRAFRKVLEPESARSPHL